MDVSSIRITEFPKDRRLWRLDGLGQISHPGNSRSEAMVAVHLSELFPNYVDPLSNTYLTGRGIVVHVKVGQIALLKYGSVWFDQARLMPKKRVTRWIAFDHTRTELMRFRADIRQCSPAECAMNLSAHNLSEESRKGLADSWLVVVKKPDKDLEFMAIPSAVIFQRCQATSAPAARRLIWGELHLIVDSPRWIKTSGERDTFYVEAFKDISSSEAKAHANLYADPVGAREYVQMRNELRLNSVNADLGRTGSPPQTYLKFGLPFSNLVDMDVAGKYISFGQSSTGKPLWAFFVTEIFSLKTQLVFERFACHRKNDGTQGENADDPDLQDRWGAKSGQTVDFDEEDDLPLHSGDDPISNLEALCIKEGGSFEAIGLELVENSKKLQQYRRRVLNGDEGVFDGTATTGEPRGGGNGSAELEINAEEELTAPITLEKFFSSLEILRAKGLQFETIKVSNFHRILNGRDVVNFFPQVIGGVRSWHLTSTGSPKQSRGYVVAVLKFGGVWHHLIELERKSDKFALAHIRTTNGKWIDTSEIRVYMNQVARSNGWDEGDLKGHWVLTRIPHLLADGVVPFTKAIANALGATIQF